VEEVMKNFMVRLLRDDEGQDLVEYVLLVSLIGLMVLAGLGTVREAVISVFDQVGEDVGPQ
jgi:Flp pilus assembly pilin Flp